MSGLVAAVWAPCRVATGFAMCRSPFPSTPTTRSAIDRARGDRRTCGPLSPPASCAGVGGRRARADRQWSGSTNDAGTLHRIERKWDGTTNITMRFPMRPSDLGPLQRGGCDRARPARVFAQDRRAVDASECRQAAPRASARRLRGPADDAWNYGLVLTSERIRPRSCDSRNARSAFGRSRRRAPEPRARSGTADPRMEGRPRLGRRAVARGLPVGRSLGTDLRPAGRRDRTAALRMHEHSHH